MEKKGTPKYCGSSSYQPSAGRGTPEPPSARARMARYWVENSASRKRRCLVGATRTTRRFSSPPAARVRHRMVSLEKPLDPGACTSKTSGPVPSGDFVANHFERMEATWSGSRWLMSGTEGHTTDHPALSLEAALSWRACRVGRVASQAVLIVIDLSGGDVSLRQPDEFTRFSVAVEGDGD